jgi:ubiquinone/menaquinone biosynthesis C-methylase UbiE
VQYLCGGVRQLKLNVGCGGSRYAFYDLNCDVNCDVQEPRVRIPNFVLSDICSLPFRDNAFQRIYAFNVLEHVANPAKAIRELNRVGKEVIVRSDKVFNLANWFTADHESVTVENALRAFPKPLGLVIKIVRFPIDHSKVFQKAVHKSFPALRKIGLLDNWDYYRLG